MSEDRRKESHMGHSCLKQTADSSAKRVSPWPIFCLSFDPLSFPVDIICPMITRPLKLEISGQVEAWFTMGICCQQLSFINGLKRWALLSTIFYKTNRVPISIDRL